MDFLPGRDSEAGPELTWIKRRNYDKEIVEFFISKENTLSISISLFFSVD